MLNKLTARQQEPMIKHIDEHLHQFQKNNTRERERIEQKIDLIASRLEVIELQGTSHTKRLIAIGIMAEEAAKNSRETSKQLAALISGMDNLAAIVKVIKS